MYVLNYQAIVSEGAAMVSTVTYLLPIIAIALGVVTVLGESHSPGHRRIALILAVQPPRGGLLLRAGKAILDGKRNADSRLSVGRALLRGL